MSGPLLTARVVADMLGVSPETVLRYVRRGDLPAIRLPGGAIRFREGDLEAWMDDRVTSTRGSVTQPAGRHPAASLSTVTQPEHEE